MHIFHTNQFQLHQSPLALWQSDDNGVTIGLLEPFRSYTAGPRRGRSPAAVSHPFQLRAERLLAGRYQSGGRLIRILAAHRCHSLVLRQGSTPPVWPPSSFSAPAGRVDAVWTDAASRPGL